MTTDGRAANSGYRAYLISYKWRCSCRHDAKVKPSLRSQRFFSLLPASANSAECRATYPIDVFSRSCQVTTFMGQFWDRFNNFTSDWISCCIVLSNVDTIYDCFWVLCNETVPVMKEMITVPLAWWTRKRDAEMSCIRGLYGSVLLENAESYAYFLCTVKYINQLVTSWTGFSLHWSWHGGAFNFSSRCNWDFRTVLPCKSIYGGRLLSTRSTTGIMSLYSSYSLLY